MHEDIIQMDKEPITDQIDIDDIPEWFWDEISDGGRTEKDEDYALHRIETALKQPGLSFNREDCILTVVNKEDYFREQYVSFIKQVERFNDISLKDFADGVPVEIWNLDQAYEERFATYVFFDRNLITLNQLVRQSDDGDRYYTGTLMDYHY